MQFSFPGGQRLARLILTCSVAAVALLLSQEAASAQQAFEVTFSSGGASGSAIVTTDGTGPNGYVADFATGSLTDPTISPTATTITGLSDFRSPDQNIQATPLYVDTAGLSFSTGADGAYNLGAVGSSYELYSQSGGYAAHAGLSVSLYPSVDTAQASYNQTSTPLQQSTVVFEGGVFKPTAAYTLAAPVVLSSLGGTINAAKGEVTLSGQIMGPGGLTLTGGTVALTNTGNSYTGATTLQGGSSLTVDNAGELGDSTTVVVRGASDLTFDTTATLGAVSIADQSGSAITFQDQSSAGGATIKVNDSDLTFADGATAGSAAISAIGGSTVEFELGATAGSADITVDASTLTFDAGSHGGAANVTVRDGSTLNFDDGAGAGSADFTIRDSAAIFEGGATAASATLDLFNSTATFELFSTAGSSTIDLANGSTAYFDDGSDGGTSAITTDAGSTIDISGLTSGQMNLGSIAGSGMVSLGDNTLIVGGNDQSTSFTGVISGQGGLTKTGSGTLTLGGNNDFSGDLTVEQGGLSISKDQNLGDGGLALEDGTTLYITASGTFAHAVTVAGDPVFNVPTGDTVTWSGQITDGATAGDVVVDGGGTLALTNTSNSYSGSTRVEDASTLVIDDGAELGQSTDIVAETGGVLKLVSSAALNAATTVTGSSGGVIEFDDSASTAGATVSLDGAILTFNDNSSAEGAAITATDGSAVSFTNSASAANASISLDDSALAFSKSSDADLADITAKDGSAVSFANSTDAGSSTITLNGSTLTFSNSSDAGDADITARNGSAIGFANSTDAGDATITLNASILAFSNTSDAGNADITARNLSTIGFANTANAGGATITLDDSGLLFEQASDAGGADIAAKDGSAISFGNSSSADAATITLDDAILEFANASGAGDAAITARNGSAIAFGDSANADGAGVTLEGSTLLFGDHAGAGDAGVVAQNGSEIGFIDNASADSAAIALQHSGLGFADDATAADANIAASNGSTVFFEGSASAGAAVIDLDGSTLDFHGSSTAGSAAINATDSSVINFRGTSSAGSAVLDVDDVTNLNFYSSSSAGASTINLTNASNLTFYGQSDGGTAAASADLLSIIDISASTGPSNNGVVDLGSIAGDGSVWLGAETLSVGGNDQSTTFSGAIADCPGGDCAAFPLGMPYAGGVLQKVGTGTLTLTGDNSYTGGTEIDGGVLNVSADDNLGAPGTTISFDGGVLQYGADFAIDPSRDILLETGGGTIDTNGIDPVIGSVISGSGPLIVTGGGLLVLTADNTYTGATTITSGTTLALSGSGSIADSSGVTDDGVFDISATTSGASIVSLGGSGQVILGGELLTLTDAAGTFSGQISGTGALLLSGGSETLSGSNSYTGATGVAAGATLALSGSGSIAKSADLIVDGTFDISSTSAGAQIVSLGGSGQVTLGGRTLTLTDASGDFSGQVSGAGGLVLAAGTEFLTGPDSFTGGTTISAGVLVLGDGGTSGSIVGDVVDNGELVFDRSDTVTFPGAISGSGVLVQAGSGTTILTGADSYAGGTLITAGTLQIGAGGTTGSIAGNVDDNGTLAFDRSDQTDYAGSISGSGALVQAGSGELVLSGSSPLTGPTTVEAGTLTVNGSIAFSPVTVLSGATLAGVGTVGSTQVNSGGVVSPGGPSIGALHINGDFGLASGATYLAQVSPAGADRVLVSGNASLAGQLSASFAGGGYGVITQYAMVTSSGALTGTFSGLTAANTPAGYLTRLTYDAHDAYLTLVSEAAALSPDSSSIHATIRTSEIEDERLIRAAVVDHLQQPGERLSVWAEGFGGSGEMTAQDGSPSLHHDHYGVVGGVDVDLGGGWRAGTGGAYTTFSLYSGDHIASAFGQAGHFLSYVGYGGDAPGFQLRAGGEVGWGADDISRQVPLLAEADRDHQGSRTKQLFVDAAWRVQNAIGVVEPHADLAAVSATSAAFQETGGTFSSLSGPSATSSATYGTVGVRAMLNQVVFGGTGITPSVDVGWRHGFGVQPPVQTVSFNTGGEVETVEGLPPIRNAAMVQAGLVADLGRGAKLSVGYDGMLSDKAWDNAAVARFSWRF
jgi:autotransporter-associated beta strand protein